MPQRRTSRYFTATVRDLTSDGRGVVAHPGGRVCFARGVWIDEVAEFELVATKGRSGVAELRTLITPSPHRIAPLCPHQGHSQGACGGCAWMFVEYSAQLQAKERRVRAALARLDRQDRVLPIRSAPATTGYRNRAQLKTDGEVIGFVSEGVRAISPIKSCAVLSAHNQQTLDALLGKLPNPAWRPRKGNRWRTIDIDETVDAGEASIDARLPFQQPNNAQNSYMRSWLGERLEQAAHGAGVELFCGSGNLTDVIAPHVPEVLAIDVSGEALAVLDHKRLAGVRAMQCDLGSAVALRRALAGSAHATLLVLDPPREGLLHRQAVFDALPGLTDVVYVSCDVASFARDVADFLKQGFDIDEVQPVDQVPHTPHVELLGRLSKRGR